MSDSPSSDSSETGHAPSPKRTATEAGREASKRRTFAVISHPDAGKSTLTEALSLHAHAISEAGAIHGKAGRRGTVSDWMDMEKARGIYQFLRPAVPLRRRHLQSRRHSGPRRLLRGHLPGALSRRQRRHAHRRGKGSRAADDETLRRLQGTGPADHHRQGAGSPSPRSASRQRRLSRSGPQSRPQPA